MNRSHILQKQKIADVVLPKIKFLISTLLCSPLLLAQAAENGQSTLEVVASPFNDDGSSEGTHAYTIGKSATALGLSLALKDTPQAVSVITRQQIDDLNATSLKEILRWSTGASEANYDAERSAFHFRGFRVDTLQYDGVPTFEDPSVQAAIDSSILDRVEIVRGATGLLNGTGDPGGAINLVRKKASSASPFASVNLSAGSWNNYRATLDTGTGFNTEGSVRGRLVISGVDSDWFIDRYKQQKWLIYGTMEFDLAANTLLRAGADYQQNRPRAYAWGNALPTGWFSDGSEINWDRHFNGAPGWSRSDSLFSNQFITLEHEFANGWKSSINYAHSRQVLDGHLAWAIGGGGYNPDNYALIEPQSWNVNGAKIFALKYRDHWDQHSVDIKLNGNFPLLNRSHQFVAGSSVALISDKQSNIQGTDMTGTYTGSLLNWNGNIPEPQWPQPNTYIDSRSRKAAVYTSTNLSLTDFWNMILGASYTNYYHSDNIQVNRDHSSSEASLHKVTPFFGTVVKLTPQISVYASYTAIFKAQDFRNKNNQPLSPIEGVNKETGIKGAFFDNKLNLAVSGFYIQQNNYAVPDQDNPDYYHETKGAISKGVEFEASGQPASGWNLLFSVTHYSLKRQNAALNTEQPRTRMTFLTSYQLPGILSNLTAGTAVRWQNRIYDNDVPGTQNGKFVSRVAEQPPYVVIDLMARYHFSRQTSLQLNINNLFDKKYYSAISYGTRNYGTPRNVTLWLKHQF